MTHVTVGLDDAEAVELAAEASRQGVQADELAHRAVVEYLQRSRAAAGCPEPEQAPLAFIAMMRSEELTGHDVDDLLAGGFGR